MAKTVTVVRKCVSGIVRWVDVDAFYLPRELRAKSTKRGKIIPMNETVIEEI
jgi:hypothetical protein